ncbi:MAG: NADH-quinone oxidoreductase subunit N [Candidatus Nitrohelix vancouverensis]|uniref:NADH-quinone oxidoreductase subunit N n=1 Tax=Candidatus Nitrohelix vancouverensis TaxID=2705534 RepID=A0A7T0C396_9BACT|nr:MAG: NADH-quinone oxidoreductase subunit N [Candidatus Nitrohelix vancouverensis]
MESIAAPEIDLVSLAPVLSLSFFGMMVLLLDLKVGRNKTLLVFVSLVGLLVASVAAFAKVSLPVTSFEGAYTVDHLSVFFTIIFTLSSALAILLSIEYNKREGIRMGEYYGLILFCTVGMILLASSTDMIMIFLGIEVISICLYVLAGIRRNDVKSNEAALKYFLLGAFATGFLLYGMALVYGATGSTKLHLIAEAIGSGGVSSETLLLLGVVLLIIGFGFKIASVPFHMWAPDVYEGAPTPVTAFMAVGPKAAALAAFFRVFSEAVPALSPSWETLVIVIAVITMFFGNIGAIVQTNIKRLLAYSSVSHVGYLLIAVVVKNSMAGSAILFYMLAYAFMIFGVFGIVILFGEKNSENLEIENYAGLGYKKPVLALCMTIFMLSLGGMPPFAGFVAKFYIFSAAIQEGYVLLVVIAVLNSVISFYYYLKVIVVMYMKESTRELNLQPGPVTALVVAVSVFGTIELGLFPESILQFTLQ